MRRSSLIRAAAVGTRSVTALGLVLLLAVRLSAGAPQAGKVPRPEDIIGFRLGSDYTLADYEQIAGYFRKLDAASDRVRVFDIGPTAEGRTQIAAVISSEENLRNLTRYKEIARRLALARDLTDEDARRLAREGKAIVWIDFGLHATEVAHGQVSSEVAYKVATEESDEMRFIRDQVIFVTVPVMNPDGLNIVARWYRRNVGTPYEVSDLPELYHRYVGHDNNRDWFMLNQPETRNVTRLLYGEFFPQIVYNQHQTGPFPARIFVPPFDDPMNPNIPPLVMRGIHLVGDAMSARFEAEGKSGVISRQRYSTWWNGGMRTAPYFHNMVGILTETQLYRYATPRQFDRKEFPRTFPDGTPTLEPTTYYPNPWQGGWWRLRDPMEYMITGSMATLNIGARLKDDWLYNIYQMGRDAIAAGRKGGPFAYVIPPEQHDPLTAARLVDILRLGAVEVHRATAPFSADGRPYPAGSFVVLMTQPFRAYAKDLLEPQRHPDRRAYPGGPPLRPYDMAGWTLPYQMSVRADEIARPFEVALEPLSGGARPAGAVVGEGTMFALDPRANDSFIAVSRLIRSGARVTRTPSSLGVGGASLPPGAFVVTAGATRDQMEKLVQPLGLRAYALTGVRPEGQPLRLPRVGLYKSYVASMDEGWARWLLEQFEIPFANVLDKDVRAGNLNARFDVIVLPDQESKEIIDGHPPGSMPPEYVGGIGLEGAAQLKTFVAAGGTLLAIDSATELPLALFGLSVRNVLEGVRSSDFYCPGSLLRMTVDTSHVATYGMAGEAAAFFVNGRAFEVVPPDEGKPAPAEVKVLARYADSNLLMSGWILGPERIAGRAAVVDAPVGQGRVILVGFNEHFRGQPHGTFKLLLNAAFMGAAAAPSGPSGGQ